MKKTRIFLPKLLLLVFGILLCGCDKPAKEQVVAAALNQELEVLNDQQPTDEEQKLSWLCQVRCMNNFRNSEWLLITDVYFRLTEINKLYRQIDTLEKIFRICYATEPNEKLTFTQDDKKALANIEVQTKNLITILEKFPGPENFTNFHRFIYPPNRASKRNKRKNWTELYLENKSAYLGILHLSAFKAALQAQKHEIFSISRYKFDTNWHGHGFVGFVSFDRHFGNVSTEYRLLPDTLKPGEKGKAMVFLGSTKSVFSCNPFTNNYPKAFIFNQQKLPILQDDKTNDLVVKVRIPTTEAELKGQKSIRKNWSGKWVIGLKDGKDTIINISGSFMVMPKAASY